MRKITGVIANQNVLFVCLNQIRTKIGVMHGDPSTTPGGNAIPFHASTRIKLGAGQQIKNSDDEVIGIHVWAKTIKNKVAVPFRRADFRIIFGKGIEEGEEMFDLLRVAGSREINGHTVCVEGNGAWKTFSVKNGDNETILEKKFYKKEFNELLEDETYRPWILDLLENVMVRVTVQAEEIELDHESYEDMRSLTEYISENELSVSPE
jgi:hypothetical protein